MTFTGNAQLTSTTNRQVWARPPIDVDFQVLMFTSSGLIVRFLKVFEKSNYHSVKWVRYLTKASGSYQIRVSPMSALTFLTSSCAAFGAQCIDVRMFIAVLMTPAVGVCCTLLMGGPVACLYVGRYIALYDFQQYRSMCRW